MPKYTRGEFLSMSASLAGVALSHRSSVEASPYERNPARASTARGFTFHIQGLSLCVFEDRLRVLMLNSGANPELDVPHHIQSLVVPRTSWDASATSIEPLPSLRGRLHHDHLAHESVGWDLSGLTVKMSAGEGCPTGTETNSGVHPPVNGAGTVSELDWSNLHWVMDARRFLPAATVKLEARTLGHLTSAIAEFTGGRVRGGTPANGRDAEWVWDFGNGVRQAVTDTLDFTTNVREPAVRLYRGTREVGTIGLMAHGEAYLINGPTLRDLERRRLAFYNDVNVRQPHALDFQALLEALDGVDDSYMPRSVSNYFGRSYEGTFCIIIKIPGRPA